VYFWNIHALKEDIKNGKLSQDTKIFPYFMMYIFLTTVAIEVTPLFPQENLNNCDILMAILNILITILGTFYLYRSNGGANGEDFLIKYFSIIFVITIRYLIYLLLPLMIILSFYWQYTFADSQTIPTTYVEIILTSIWLIVLYYRTAYHIRDTNR